jgi:hypothetical protein
MKELKFLYETSLNRSVEETVTETRTENGETIQVQRKVKKLTLFKLAILKPDRKLFKAAEMFYAKTLADYLKAGLLPYSLVAKRYANDGGPLTDKEKSRLEELKKEAQELEKEFYTMLDKTPEAQDRKNALLVKINAINTEASNIQNAYSDIFDSTAEMKSRNDIIEWWSLFLLYEEKDAGYQPIFGSGTYDERVEALESFEDTSDPFYVEAIKRLSYLVSFWFAAKDTVTAIDFQTMEKLYIDTISKYKPKESVDTKIVEVPAETKLENG